MKWILGGATFGNTSTDVEKTQSGVRSGRSLRKHLHGRGEDSISRQIQRRPLETPPRTWRRPVVLSDQGRRFGNTSTDVEKTCV